MGLAQEARHFLRLLVEKLEDDDAVFIASALAWGVLVAMVPLLALAIGLAGFALSARFEDPTQAVVSLFAGVLPSGGSEIDLAGLLSRLVSEVVVNRTGITLVGAVVFVLFATRLSASLRSVLYRVFEVGVRRGVLHGKLFDVAAVLVGVVLVTLDVGITLEMTTAVGLGVSLFGWTAVTASYAEHLLAVVLGFASSWILFLIIYRYVPARRTRWRTAVLAATLTSLAHEILKAAFSWYLVEVAVYTSALGNLATVAVLLLWIYCGALVFIVGGEMAYVYAIWDARRSARAAPVAAPAASRARPAASPPESAPTGTP
ncbi:MAG TPA: YihY/virulence factor BrkB family protein [Longimicrobiales bacterium]|nr:YihY/virulence factor BrkB family protein [Longimicrobiales bacterium]